MSFPLPPRGTALALLLAGLLAAPCAFAFPPERRRQYEDRSPNEYLVVPAVASLPGIGVFVGVISSVSNIADSKIDAAAAVAESIDNTDISLQALALREVPLWRPWLSLEYQYAHIRLGNFQTFLPGRDSPNFTIPITAEFDVQVVRPVLRLWERRVSLFYTLAFFDGFSFDENGNEYPVRRHSASTDLRLDFTDDVVNPRRGVRFHVGSTLNAPRHTFLGRDRLGDANDPTESDVRVESYEVSGYLPVAEHAVLAADLIRFRAIGEEGSDRVIAGGSPPLRGYPAGRWSDRYGIFLGLEGRYTFPMFREIDVLLAHGLLEGIEAAAFYEVGQVSPREDNSLYRDMHHSYGMGARLVFEAIVLRLDLAFSDEGPQTHLTIDQPF